MASDPRDEFFFYIFVAKAKDFEPKVNYVKDSAY